MVKAGFIVEGASERIIVESDIFKGFLRSAGYELVTPVVDAQGGGNLLPHNIEAFIDRLKKAEAERIFVLTDLEDEASVKAVRERISDPSIHFIFIAVKALEAWYLADSRAMNKWLEVDDFHEASPESTPAKPWERLKQVAAERDKRGPGNKVAFAKKIIKYWDFSIESAATHPNCPSATELVRHFQSVEKMVDSKEVL